MKQTYTIARNHASLRGLLRAMEANDIRWIYSNSPDDFIKKNPSHLVIGIGADGAPIGTSCESAFVSMGMRRVSFESFIASLAEKQIIVALNYLYSAVVTRAGTTVGCQTFDNGRILEVAEAIKKLS